MSIHRRTFKTAVNSLRPFQIYVCLTVSFKEHIVDNQSFEKFIWLYIPAIFCYCSGSSKVINSNCVALSFESFFTRQKIMEQDLWIVDF